MHTLREERSLCLRRNISGIRIGPTKRRAQKGLPYRETTTTEGERVTGEGPSEVVLASGVGGLKIVRRSTKVPVLKRAIPPNNIGHGKGGKKAASGRAH